MSELPDGARGGRDENRVPGLRPPELEQAAHDVQLVRELVRLGAQSFGEALGALELSGELGPDYGGLVRRKNVLSVMMQCFAICCVVSLLWLLGGYSLAFGDGGAHHRVQPVGGDDEAALKRLDPLGERRDSWDEPQEAVPPVPRSRSLKAAGRDEHAGHEEERREAPVAQSPASPRRRTLGACHEDVGMGDDDSQREHIPQKVEAVPLWIERLPECGAFAY